MHLHRRGAAREHRHAVVRGVAGQVDQHVDAVRFDALAQCRIGHARHRQPVFHHGLDAPGDGIPCAGGCIGEQFHARTVVAGEQLLDEVAHRMLPEIARDIPNLQAAPAAGWVPECPAAGRFPLRSRHTGQLPAARQGKIFIRLKRRVIRVQKKQAAVCLRIVRLQFQRLVETRDRLVQLALIA